MELFRIPYNGTAQNYYGTDNITIPLANESKNAEHEKLIAAAVVICFVSVAGLVLNITGIHTIRNIPKNCKLFNNLIICLLSFDSCILITAPFFFFGVKHEHFDCMICAWLVPYWAVPFGHMALHGSVIMTLAISHERYLAVRDPLHRNQALITDEAQKKRLLVYLIPTLIVVVSANIPRFFDFEILTNSLTTYVKLSLTDQMCNRHYIIFYETILNNIIFGFVPFFCLIFLGYKTYRAFKEHNSQRAELFNQENDRIGEMQERQMAKVMTSLVLTFVVCHSPRIALHCYNSIKHRKRCDIKEFGYPMDLYMIANQLCVFMVLVNSSIGTILYCATSSEFRNHLFLNLKKCFGRRNVVKTISNVVQMLSSNLQNNPRGTSVT
jgi:hypothetical protein